MIDLQPLLEKHLGAWDADILARRERGYGSIHVITGAPYAGKSDKIENLLRGRLYIQRHAQRFTYGEPPRPRGTARKRWGNRPSLVAQPVLDCAELRVAIGSSTDVVAIDDAHHMEALLWRVCEELAAKRAVDVVVGGRDTDEDGRPVPSLGAIMCDADEIEKMLLPCQVCGQDTNRWRLVRGTKGNFDTETICRRCRAIPQGAVGSRRGNTGRLHLLVGPQGSGKSVEHERLIKNYLAARAQVQVFYPARFPGRLKKTIVSNRGQDVDPEPIRSVRDIVLYRGTTHVFIDSLHGLEPTDDCARTIDELATRGVQVFVNASGVDEAGKIVQPVADLLCLAEEAKVMLGPCQVCHRMNATRIARVSRATTLPPGVPDWDAFEPRCREHFA